MARKSAQDGPQFVGSNKTVTNTNPLPKQTQALNAQEQRFVDEYLVDLDVPRAAIAAGYSETTARSKAYTWVSSGKQNPKPHVYAAIVARQHELQEKTQITQEMVLDRLWMIATANPNELMIHRRICCRHCWGVDHQYQWENYPEWAKAVAQANRNDIEPPSMDGGLDYDRTVAPHPKCPKCKGEGEGDTLFKDTTKLSAPALALYAGVKHTRFGMEILTHDQMSALVNVAKHLGMFNEKLTIKGDEADPITLLLTSLAGKTIGPKKE